MLLTPLNAFRDTQRVIGVFEPQSRGARNGEKETMTQIYRMELVRRIPYEKLSKEEQKGRKKTDYKARVVLIRLEGELEDVQFVKALLLKQNDIDWTSEE